MPDIWASLFLPLIRLLVGLSIGLLVANLLETLQWTATLARFAKPLARLAHFHPVSGAAFSLAFVSSASANGLLSDAWSRGGISSTELVLANLFNSFPAYLVHLPSLFLLIWPVLGFPAAIYVGLSLLAALGRTILTLIFGHFILPAKAGCVDEKILPGPERATKAPVWRKALLKAWKRFLGRLSKLLLYTIPIYILMYILQRGGFFAIAQGWLAEQMAFLSFLKPQMMGIIIFHLAAELGPALGAAGSLLQEGALTSHEIIVALLVGNIVSTPMRAIRHQLPAYSGFYRPTMALWLIIINQGLRAISMIAVTVIYVALCA